MKYSVLINTCDKFEDCWNPFFKLFKLYWSDCKENIYLNTEYKDYSYPGVDIISVKGCVKHNVSRNKRATWSQCLKWALEEMETDIVLYMQEDYFFNGKVDTETIDYYVDLMKTHKEIPCIQLTTSGFPETEPSEIPNLYLGDVNHTAYVSCQASLWRKDVMLSLIREYESAWNFEWYGSQRAKYQGIRFLTVSKEYIKKRGSDIMPYLKTGVIGGKWYKPTVKLFADHDIPMNFELRGFYDKTRKRSLFEKVKFKLNFIKFRSVFEIFLLRIKVLR